MANFRDGPGTPSAKSISSCSVKPSFWAYAGRLYFATSVSMVTSAMVYASLKWAPRILEGMETKLKKPPGSVMVGL